MSIQIAGVLGGVCALVCTILLYTLVFPDSREKSLNKFFLFVKNFFGLKYLIIEKIARFIYVLETMTCICGGFFLIFARIDSWYHSESTALYGLILIVVGPIVFRLIYELFMITILLVKNTMEINSKIKGDATGATSQFETHMPMPEVSFGAPAAQYGQTPYNAPPAQPQGGYYPDAGQNGYYADPSQAQGGYYAPAGVCPSCGAALSPDSPYCPSCGVRIDAGQY